MSFARQRAALALCIGLALAGCAAAPPPMLVTLPATAAGPAAAPPAGATARVIALRRLEIPEYLKARRIRFRADDATLAEWPNAYWAERLEVAATEAFGDALRRHLPGWEICESSCSERSAALSLQLQLTRMDYVRNEKRLHAEARLSVWSTDRPARLVRTEQRSYTIDGGADSPQSHARAIAQLLDRLAEDAAPSVGAFQPAGSVSR